LPGAGPGAPFAVGFASVAFFAAAGAGFFSGPRAFARGPSFFFALEGGFFTVLAFTNPNI
jgi:hypothetical protein